jgi:uncharacterized membrane protein
MLDQILNYTIPVNHPIVVHFPIALAFVALAFALGWLVRNRAYWLNVTFWLTALAWIGTLVALRTGELMEEQGEGIAIVDEFVHLHEDMGEWASWALGACLVWLLFALWHSRNDVQQSGTRLWIRIVALVLLVVAAALVGLTGHIGGIMTWGVPA